MKRFRVDSTLTGSPGIDLQQRDTGPAQALKRQVFLNRKYHDGDE
jgi:hypothetical protein